MSGWDIFVLSSLWDPFPQVILEAMANGLPIVSTAVDGACEMIVDGETGILVPPGDAVALAAGIRRLLNDPELAERLGKAGRQRLATVYSIERVVGDLDKLYQDVCP
jgi:glycosyltransferase involved in cell wall biosynthesis